MELSEKFGRTLKSLTLAIDSFDKSLEADFSGLDPVGIDLIKNGRIQKFEYCTELAWKVSKVFVELHIGIINSTPKEVYRSMFRDHLIDEDLFLALHKGIDDRNRLSHIYKEEMYELIYADLPRHLAALKGLLSVLDNNYRY